MNDSIWKYPGESSKLVINSKIRNMIIQFIRLKTTLPVDELMRRAREREPQFKALPGLLQKYYVQMSEPGEYGGIYVWDTLESLQAFRKTELAASIPGAYEVIEAPALETLKVLFQLRESQIR